MKKIGLLTLQGNNNFGNKLQNYATVYFLQKINCNIETIDIKNCFVGNYCKQILRILYKTVIELFDFKRTINFIRFNKFLNYSKKKIIFNNDINKVKDYYDIFLVGSDQVWNYNFSNNFDIFLLENIKINKVANSASFGINDIPIKYMEIYRKSLNDFRYISVRENRGKEIVEMLTDRKDVEVLIDPTMLLTADEWDIIAKRPKKLKNDKFILNYFLGELSEQKKKDIDRIAKENCCQIINILNKNDPLYNSGPREFLYLEKNAFLICTDSFHSSVFALLYDKPFIVFDRDDKKVENMNSRIDTLLDKFKLKNRRYNGKCITDENLKHDYSEAYKILKVEREKSVAFLKKALDIK